jgi:superfamily II DNA or RNA helicase
MVTRQLNLNSIDDYQLFLRIKQLPTYSITGRVASFPDEYADRLGIAGESAAPAKYNPLPGLFDYQQEISRIAIQKQRFAVFADCGLGKTLMLAEFARHAAKVLPKGQCVLIVSPLMVVPQTIAELKKFYGDSLPIEQVDSGELGSWLESGKSRIGITNYEALRPDIVRGRLGALIADESSIMKSHYGKWGQKLIDLGKGLQWKLCLTGTPAPNDRIEYANHAVFLDQFPTVNAFLARYFVNRGQTSERWELKPHALRPFYRSLSHWSIFLTNPAVYGWKDNTKPLPPIHIHAEDVEMTEQQVGLTMKQTGSLFAHKMGGIVGRASLGSIAKGRYKGESVDTRKPGHIKASVDSWPDESTIIWCMYNHEQDLIADQFPDCANISGDTPHDTRMVLIDDFKAERRRVLVSKSKILGFGLNLQVCTRMIFSGLQDSYESFYQAVKRANRYGSTKPLNVHIPVTDIERPMIETVMAKASRIQQDTETQEQLFREMGYQNA